jgi:hypothetical protein
MADMDTLVEIKDLHTYFHLTEGVRGDGSLTPQRGWISGRAKSTAKQPRLCPTGAPPGKIEANRFTNLLNRTAARQWTVNITALDPKGKEKSAVSAATTSRWCSRNL